MLASEKDEASRQAGVLLALRTGLLKKCPVHGELYDAGQHDYQGALMIAGFLFNQSDPLVAPLTEDRSDLSQLLRSICQAHPSACPQCASANGSQLA